MWPCLDAFLSLKFVLWVIFGRKIFCCQNARILSLLDSLWRLLFILRLSSIWKLTMIHVKFDCLNVVYILPDDGQLDLVCVWMEWNAIVVYRLGSTGRSVYMVLKLVCCVNLGNLGRWVFIIFPIYVSSFEGWRMSCPVIKPTCYLWSLV